ncbi:MAG: VIT1/CCC1 transporter family protein, partial [Sphingomonadaceae bacterium]
DALGAHARDELHITDATSARPVQAAAASAASFTAGAAAPMLAVMLAPLTLVVPAVITSSMLCLALLGYLGASAGSAPIGKSVFRVTFWGAAAMAVTAGIGKIAGVAV